VRLLDARKLAVKQQVCVRFGLSNGMECVIDEHGLSKVPRLSGPPGFNLEEEFARAERFVLELLTREKRAERVLTRQELEGMIGSVAPGRAAEEHEE